MNRFTPLIALIDRAGKEEGRLTTKLALVVRAKSGDTDAFQTLIHEDKEKLYKMAYVYMKNEGVEFEKDGNEIEIEFEPYDGEGIELESFTVKIPKKN